MTPRERRLWYEFLRSYPVRFQRQKAIGKYMADFYCARVKLVVELDGSGHYEETQIRKDDLRTQALHSMGIPVIRICNTEIDKNFSGVCEYINWWITNSLPQSPTAPAPSDEGAGWA